MKGEVRTSIISHRIKNSSEKKEEKRTQVYLGHNVLTLF